MVKKKGLMIPLKQRKGLVNKEDPDFSVSQQCEILSIHRSALYYKPKEVSKKDMQIMELMDRMYQEDPTRGTRRYCADLALEGIKIGRDKARSLMRIMCIMAVYCKARTTVIDPGKYKYPYLLRNRIIDRPNQAWGIDISYIPMKNGFMYLCAIIDLHSRYIVGWSISNSMEAAWVVQTVQEAIRNYGKPDIINSDQGVQFTSNEYVNYIKSLRTVKISMDGKGRATDNAQIERWFRTIKYDKIYLNPPGDGLHLYQLCDEFISYYNNRRSHSQIGKVPPVFLYRKVA